MNKKFSISSVIILMLIAAFLSFQITYTVISDKYESTILGLGKWQNLNSKLDHIDSSLSQKNADENDGEKTESDFNKLYEKLAEIDYYARTEYIDEIDEQFLSDYVMSGYMYGIKDKFAAYLPPEEYSAYMASMTDGTMVGIGVRIIYDNTLGGMYVTSVMPETPAYEAGVSAGDVILAVNGNYVDDVGYYTAYNMIRDGAEGDSVNLTVATAASQYAEYVELSVVRRSIRSENVTSKIIGKDIGYIKIYEFETVTGTDFNDHLTKLLDKGATKFIFDVRGNPGGNLVGVRDTLDRLLPEGPIVRIIGNDGKVNVLYSDAKCLDMPMTVLVNGSTASAAELFASALKDYGVAKIVGTTTYGKGTMQSIIPLSDGSAIKFSTEMYCPPYSNNYNGLGVAPNVTIELDELGKSIYLYTESEDNQLQTAISILNEQ